MSAGCVPGLQCEMLTPGLSQHLTTKDMLGVVVLSSKEVLLNGLNV